MKKTVKMTIKIDVEITEDFEVTNCEKIEKEIFGQFKEQLEPRFGRMIPRDRSGKFMLWGLSFNLMPFASKEEQ